MLRFRIEPAAAGLSAPPMLLQPRHDLDEVAGPVAVVELPLEDVVPGVAAGAGRARQAEDVGALRDARRRRATGSSRSPIFSNEIM